MKHPATGVAFRLAATALAASLAGCAGPRPGPPEPATLASLSTRPATVPADPGLPATPEQTIAAYRRFVDVAVAVPQRAEALRRLGDLEMDAADRRAARATGDTEAVPDYRAARDRYEDFLRTYPDSPRRDRVLYQLARAQEQAGEMDAALKTLTTLVQQHPGTLHVSEAQFRRGEMLFALRDYAAAEGAYAAVLAYEGPQTGALRRSPPEGLERAGLAPFAQEPHTETSPSPLVERALYMRGWSFYKLGRLDEALQAFFRVLDLKLAALPPVPREEAELGIETAASADWADIPQLTRADRELIADTLRVVGISLASLNGAASIPRHIDGVAVPTETAARLRASYQFRVYRQLADLYLKQDRPQDAAGTLNAFLRLQPLHAQAPAMQARVVQIQAERGYTQQALQARRDTVRRFGPGEDGRAYARAQPTLWRAAQAQVQASMAELARHHHAQSQALRGTPAAAADVEAAVGWYRALLQQLAATPGTAPPRQAQATRFLLAELLFENRRWAEAAADYEQVADGGMQGSPAETDAANAANAGYGALLAYAELEAQATDTAARQALQRRAVASALRFAQAQPQDARCAAVLVHAAEQLQALGDGAQAAAVARQALALRPEPAATLRRAAWTVVAQQAVEAGADVQAQAEAEAAYAQVLALTPPATPEHAVVAERLAATIYRQGEAARAQGQARTAVGHFDRAAALSALPSTSPVRAAAQFDAATALIGLQDWPAAARALEDFRRGQAGHPLQADVAPKLALAYEAMDRPEAAAAELERVAAAPGQAGDITRSALWRAAELRARAATGTPPRSAVRAAAIQAHERLLAPGNPASISGLESTLEIRSRLAGLLQADGQAARALLALQAVQQADAEGGTQRTPRTRTLGGQAALVLAEPAAQAYRAVPLVEPLARQLKLKKARFEDALRAYGLAAAVGVVDIATQATFHTAALYQDFGRALTTSARPKKLSKAELEQYNVMLEEQAFPFEEQAIALFEANARRAADGVYDQAVRDSYTELARLKPARWGKAERSDANALNQQGIAERQAGRFDEARRAFEAAIAQDGAAVAPQLNLGILQDLYLGDASAATAQYQRALALSPDDAPLIRKWLAELKTRKPAAATNSPPLGATAANAAPKEPS